MDSRMSWSFLLLLSLVVSVTAVNPQSQNLCQDCRKIVSFMERFNKTVNDQLAPVLQNFCEQYYPPSTDFQQGPCSVFVQGVTYVLSNTNPVTHCDEINVCGPGQPSDDIYQYIDSSNSITSRKPDKDDKAICDYCESSVLRAKAILSDPGTVRKVREQGKAFCDYLKVVDFDAECKAKVDDLISRALDIIQSVDPQDYCASIHLCPQRASRATSLSSVLLPTLADFNNFGIETAVQIGPKPTDVTSKQQSSTPQCTLCKTFVKEMFHFLRENKTEANIIKGLDYVCKTLYPSGPKLGQCRSMVKAYTRELVQLLVDETDPEVICMLLEQCAYSKPEEKRQDEIGAATQKVSVQSDHSFFNLTQLITALDPNIPIGSLRSCVECRMFIKYLRDKLESQTSQAEIKQWLLDNLCRELPEDNLVKSCSSMVESYSEVFFKAVIGDLNPQTACVELGVCNAKMRNVFDFAHSTVSTARPASPKPATPKPGPLRELSSCHACSDVVSLIDDYLAIHPSSNEIEVFSEVCKSIDDPWIKDRCSFLARIHGARILERIPSMESPGYLCWQIGEC